MAQPTGYGSSEAPAADVEEPTDPVVEDDVAHDEVVQWAHELAV